MAEPLLKKVSGIHLRGGVIEKSAFRGYHEKINASSDCCYGADCGDCDCGGYCIDPDD